MLQANPLHLGDGFEIGDRLLPVSGNREGLEIVVAVPATQTQRHAMINLEAVGGWIYVVPGQRTAISTFGEDEIALRV
jgi:hypothetical protein